MSMDLAFVVTTLCLVQCLSACEPAQNDIERQGGQGKDIRITVHWLPNRTIDTNLDWAKKYSLSVRYIKMIQSILSGTVIFCLF